MFSLLQLIAPVRCLECGKSGSLCCKAHKPVAALNPMEVAGVAGYYLTEFDGIMAKMLRAFKDHSITSLKREFAHLIHGLIGPMGCEFADVWLIPPSTKKAFRKRGFVPMRLVLGTVRGHKRILSLKLARQVSDQRVLTAADRARNLTGAFELGPVDGKRVFLFDDVSTTNSTLVEMIRAATKAGCEVIGFCVLAKRLPNFETGDSK